MSPEQTPRYRAVPNRRATNNDAAWHGCVACTEWKNESGHSPVHAAGCPNTPAAQAAAVEWLTALARGEAVPGCAHTEPEGAS